MGKVYANRSGKRSKFGVRTDPRGKQERTYDGILFASKREMRRYQELKLLERAGEIRNLALQVPLVLSAGNDRRTSIGKYVSDFVYQERDGQDWITRVEDVKGYDTPLSKWKRKHVTAQYGIEVRIV